MFKAIALFPFTPAAAIQGVISPSQYSSESERNPLLSSHELQGEETVVPDPTNLFGKLIDDNVQGKHVVFMTHGFIPNTAFDFSLWQRFFAKQNMHCLVHDYKWWKKLPSLRGTRDHAIEFKNFIHHHLQNLPELEGNERYYVHIIGYSFGGLVAQLAMPDILPTLHKLDMEPGNLITLSSPHGKHAKHLTKFGIDWFWGNKLGFGKIVDHSFDTDAWYHIMDWKDLPQMEGIIKQQKKKKVTHVTAILKSKEYLSLSTVNGRSFRKIAMSVAAERKFGSEFSAGKNVVDWLETQMEDFRGAVQKVCDGMFQLTAMIHLPKDREIFFKNFDIEGAAVGVAIPSGYDAQSDWLNLILPPSTDVDQSNPRIHGDLTTPLRNDKVKPFETLFFGPENQRPPPSYPVITVMPQKRGQRLDLLKWRSKVENLYRVQITGENGEEEYFIPGKLSFGKDKDGYLTILKSNQKYDDWLAAVKNKDEELSRKWMNKVQKHTPVKVSKRSEIFRKTISLAATDFGPNINSDVLADLKHWVNTGQLSRPSTFKALVQARSFDYNNFLWEQYETFNVDLSCDYVDWRISDNGNDVFQIAPTNGDIIAEASWSGVQHALKTMAKDVANTFSIPSEVLTRVNCEKDLFLHELLQTLWTISTLEKDEEQKYLLFRFIKTICGDNRFDEAQLTNYFNPSA